MESLRKYHKIVIWFMIASFLLYLLPSMFMTSGR